MKTCAVLALAMLGCAGPGLRGAVSADPEREPAVRRAERDDLLAGRVRVTGIDRDLGPREPPGVAGPEDAERTPPIVLLFLPGAGPNADRPAGALRPGRRLADAAAVIGAPARADGAQDAVDRRDLGADALG